MWLRNFKSSWNLLILCSLPHIHILFIFCFSICIWQISLWSLKINRLISVHSSIYSGTQYSYSLQSHCFHTRWKFSCVMSLKRSLFHLLIPWLLDGISKCFNLLSFSGVCYYYLNLFLYDSIVVLFSIYSVNAQSCCFGPLFCLQSPFLSPSAVLSSPLIALHIKIMF